jgi:hypothetical protein
MAAGSHGDSCLRGDVAMARSLGRQDRIALRHPCPGGPDRVPVVARDIYSDLAWLEPAGVYSPTLGSSLTSAAVTPAGESDEGSHRADDAVADILPARHRCALPYSLRSSCGIVRSRRRIRTRPPRIVRDPASTNRPALQALAELGVHVAALGANEGTPHGGDHGPRPAQASHRPDGGQPKPRPP